MTRGRSGAVGAGPERTCISCRKTTSIDALVRYVRTGDGQVIEGRHAPGRGAWVCAAGDCLAAADRTGAFGRAFRAASRRETPR